jgi:hypothetical protein
MRRYLLAVAAVGMLAGCGGSSGGEAASASLPSQASVPDPTAAQRVMLVAALGRIDAGLVADQDRAVRRARDVCADLQAGKPAAAVQQNARARFEGGAVPSLTAAQAAQIVAAVQTSFCT